MKNVWQKTPKIAQKLLLFAVSMVILAGLSFGGLLLIIQNGSRDVLNGTPEVMIILGCQVLETGPSSTLQNRLDKALEYLEEFPDLVVITSGGQGSNEPMTEAKAMADYLVEHGVSAEQIYQEGNSSNTHENLTYTIELMEEEGISGDIIIVSSDFHLPRAKMLWKRVGGNTDNFSQLAAPVTDPYAIKLNFYREPLALVKSFLLDQGRA